MKGVFGIFGEEIFNYYLPCRYYGTGNSQIIQIESEDYSYNSYGTFLSNVRSHNESVIHILMTKMQITGLNSITIKINIMKDQINLNHAVNRVHHLVYKRINGMIVSVCAQNGSKMVVAVTIYFVYFYLVHGNSDCKLHQPLVIH